MCPQPVAMLGVLEGNEVGEGWPEGDDGAQPLLSFVCFLISMSEQHPLSQAPSMMLAQAEPWTEIGW